MRKGLTAVYAVARLGDDIADELETVNVINPVTGMSVGKVQGLHVLDNVVDGTFPHQNNPVFMAIQDTIARHNLPSAPFHRLFEAFRRDVSNDTTIMTSWDDVYDYCSYSANPVGELMLRLSGDWETSVQPYSDAICTALQITNFLQDISVDTARSRHYIPGMPSQPLSDLQTSRKVLCEARSIANDLYAYGKAIVHVPKSLRLRLELRAIITGGTYMLRKCTEKILYQRSTL